MEKQRIFIGKKNEHALVYEGGRLSIFGGITDLEAFMKIEAALISVDASYSTVVVDDNNAPLKWGRFVIANEAEAEKSAEVFIVGIEKNAETTKIVPRVKFQREEASN